MATIDCGGELSSWRYTSMPRDATCCLYGDCLTVTLTLEGGPMAEAPDVCEVESWLAEFLSEPTCVELLAVAAAARWRMAATARGVAPGHGELEARCEA